MIEKPYRQKMNDSLATIRLDDNRAICAGEWTSRQLGSLPERLLAMRWPDNEVRVDLDGVQRMDTTGAWVLYRLCSRLRAAGHAVKMVNIPQEAAGLLELVAEQGQDADRLLRPSLPSALESLGRTSLQSLQSLIGLVGFVGQVWLAGLRTLPHPTRVRWRELAHELGEAGYKALPIVGLLSFLLGIVITYQGGVQLRQYGAGVFVADLVGLSTLRELAPIITAIIVAGRTGSAYTAQIGTMQVTEEIDALRSIGIQPLELLVLPKLLALLITLPLLTVYADFMGVLGGMVMAKAQLDISYATFIDRLQVALTVKSYLVGLGKAPIFAAFIALIGCYQGLQVGGSAESVGRRTTISVVQSILAVIVVDAIFSVAFSYLNI